jgi:hypothetical protein
LSESRKPELKAASRGEASHLGREEQRRHELGISICQFFLPSFLPLSFFIFLFLFLSVLLSFLNVYLLPILGFEVRASCC